MNAIALLGHTLSQPIGALSQASSQSWLPYIIALLIGYPLLTNSLRYRRLHQMHKKYHYPTRESLASMTDQVAFEILHQISQLEFPFFFFKALQFGLFRTYGIPSISTLLTKTGQLSSPQTSMKRYADTAALIGEMIGNSPCSSRAQLSLARTRFLHAGYRAAGKIHDSDMLFTLALFALQPVRFIAMFEWRELSDLERCAVGTFWKSIGDALGVGYEVLPSGQNGKGFRDGMQWLEELGKWSDAYEERCMLPHTRNRETADQTTAVLLYMLPRALHPVGMQFVAFMMDERLREAMLYDPPSPHWAFFFSGLLKARQWFLRYLMPPRPSFLRMQNVSEQNADSRFFALMWDAAPYYVQPTVWNRWGPTAWVTWALGLPVPGDEGDKYSPKGYRIEDVGPKYFEGKGRGEMERTVQEVRGMRRKCPFH